jgi:hypothetical protein
MKVLSVKNPWAYWIMYYGKTVENRTWKTDFRGRILIHASMRWDNVPYSRWQGVLKGPITFMDVDKEIEKCKSLNGHILGSVEIYDCVCGANDSWAQPGFWHWILKDPKPCQPIPVKGSLGLWEYMGEIKP